MNSCSCVLDPREAGTVLLRIDTARWYCGTALAWVLPPPPGAVLSFRRTDKDQMLHPPTPSYEREGALCNVVLMLEVQTLQRSTPPAPRVGSY